MRTITKQVPIEKIEFDEELYPRSEVYWATSFQYKESMRTGSKFPPITLAILYGKFYLVDGRHRLEAAKLLKKEVIIAEIFTGWSRRKIFEEAIKRNVSHGQRLSPYEKRKIALKLRGFKYTNKQISQLIQVPLDKLEEFVAQRLVNTITGQTIVKSGVKHLAGANMGSRNVVEVEQEQKIINIESQANAISQLIYLLENKLIDRKNKKVEELLDKLSKLL